MRDDNESIKNVIEKYNILIEKKYIDDQLSLLLKTYNSNEYDYNCLEYFQKKLMQRTSNYCKEKFHELCKKNNYLFPDLSKEIDENCWRWTHYVWDTYRDYMDEKEKSDLYKFANTKIENSINDIEKYRINALLKYKPLS